VLVSISPKLERPKWLRAPAPVGENYRDLKGLIDRLRLHTVCESAACPNVGECWNHRTATFMMLGNVCTRRCGFCAVQKGAPLPVDYDEPARIAELPGVEGEWAALLETAGVVTVEDFLAQSKESLAAVEGLSAEAIEKIQAIVDENVEVVEDSREEAAEAALAIHPKIAVPMHYGAIVGADADALKFKSLVKHCQVEII